MTSKKITDDLQKSRIVLSLDIITSFTFLSDKHRADTPKPAGRELCRRVYPETDMPPVLGKVRNTTSYLPFLPKNIF